MTNNNKRDKNSQAPQSNKQKPEAAPSSSQFSVGDSVERDIGKFY